MNPKTTQPYDHPHLYRTAHSGRSHLGGDSYRGAHRSFAAAHRAVPRNRTPDRQCFGHLYRCQCRDRTEECRRTAGGGAQRRGEHDVHDLHGVEQRFGQDFCLLPPGDRPRHGDGQRPEPHRHGAGTAPGRSHEERHHCAQAPDKQHQAAGRIQPRRLVRRGFSDQLHEDQHRTAPVAYCRRRRGERFRLRILDAHLARPGQDAEIRTGAFGHHHRARRTERRGSDWNLGRRIGEHVSICAEIPRPLRA